MEISIPSSAEGGPSRDALRYWFARKKVVFILERGPMPLPLDAHECLRNAQSCFEMANAATSAELKDQYLELAKQYTELAGAIERLLELNSELEKLRSALTT